MQMGDAFLLVALFFVAVFVISAWVSGTDDKVYGDVLWQGNVPDGLRKYAYVLGPGVVRSNVNCSSLSLEQDGCALSGTSISVPECVLLAEYCGEEIPRHLVAEHIFENNVPCSVLRAQLLTERVILLEWVHTKDMGDSDALRRLCACDLNSLRGAIQSNPYNAAAYFLLCGEINAVREMCRTLRTLGEDSRRNEAFHALCSELLQQ